MAGFTGGEGGAFNIAHYGKETGMTTHIDQESGAVLRNEVDERQTAEEPCSEGQLRRVTGEEDLGAVRNLVLTVNTNETQVRA